MIQTPLTFHQSHWTAAYNNTNSTDVSLVTLNCSIQWYKLHWRFISHIELQHTMIQTPLTFHQSHLTAAYNDTNSTDISSVTFNCSIQWYKLRWHFISHIELQHTMIQTSLTFHQSHWTAAYNDTNSTDVSLVTFTCSIQWYKLHWHFISHIELQHTIIQTPLTFHQSHWTAAYNDTNSTDVSLVTFTCSIQWYKLHWHFISHIELQHTMIQTSLTFHQSHLTAAYNDTNSPDISSVTFNCSIQWYKLHWHFISHIELQHTMIQTPLTFHQSHWTAAYNDTNSTDISSVTFNCRIQLYTLIHEFSKCRLEKSHFFFTNACVMYSHYSKLWHTVFLLINAPALIDAPPSIFWLVTFFFQPKTSTKSFIYSWRHWTGSTLCKQIMCQIRIIPGTKFGLPKLYSEWPIYDINK